MTEALIFLFLGLAFLAALLWWVTQSPDAAPAHSSDSRSCRIPAFTNVSGESPHCALAERIFAPQDWDYLRSTAAPEIQRTFLRERKALALTWLRQTRSSLARIMQAHRRAARMHADLQPGQELRLAYQYAIFLSAYSFLYSLVLLRGPFAARSMVTSARSIADRMTMLSGQATAGLDAIALRGIES